MHSGNLTLEELRKMYFEMKDTVFRKQSRIVTHVCNTDALETLLKEKLGTETTMNSVRKPKYVWALRVSNCHKVPLSRVLITAVDKSTTKLPLVFFSNCSCPEDSDKKFIENG